MNNIIKYTKVALIVFTIPLILTAFNLKKVDIGYTIKGSGIEKVIVLHSWNGDAESYMPIIPYLNLKKYSYVFMDVRGYGKSKNIKGNFNSDEIACDIFNLADKLNFDKFYLIGHSFTGIAIQKAALKDKSNRIKKVIAIAPVPANGLTIDEKGLQFFKSVAGNYKVTKAVFNAFSSNRLSDKWVSTRAKRNIEVTNHAAQTAYIKMFTEEDFLTKMKDVKTPFLVITGEFDHPDFVQSKQLNNFNTFQNVEFLDIKNAGHFPMQETPLYFATSIENYLSK